MITDPKTAGSPTQCAYRGCADTPRVTRATATGVLAHYCRMHARAAELVFEAKK